MRRAKTFSRAEVSNRPRCDELPNHLAFAGAKLSSALAYHCGRLSVEHNDFLNGELSEGGSLGTHRADFSMRC